MQHIGIIIEDEKGNLVKDSGLNFAPVLRDLIISESNKNLQKIDRYSDTVFSYTQIPIIISELENSDIKDDTLLKQTVDFLKTATSNTNIKFVGD